MRNLSMMVASAAMLASSYAEPDFNRMPTATKLAIKKRRDKAKKSKSNIAKASKQKNRKK